MSTPVGVVPIPWRQAMASRRQALNRLALGAAALSVLPLAQADEQWPTKTITIITPTSAGSGTDTLARALAQIVGFVRGRV